MTELRVGEARVAVCSFVVIANGCEAMLKGETKIEETVV
jgi:hypothetical protein